jgi:uncharacterized membrane protein YdjX (TVP38/TMEM64 family)
VKSGSREEGAQIVTERHYRSDRPGAPSIAIVVIVLMLAPGCSVADNDLVVWLERVADHPLAPVAVVALFVASGFVAAPLTVVMVPTILVYGPGAGSLWTAVGATIAGGLFFWLGSRGAGFVGRLRPRSVDRSRLGRLVERNGIIAVAVARNLPLGPYPVVNLALGATPVTLPQFLIGNLLGLAPWIALYSLSGAEIRTLFADPEPGVWIRLSLILAVIAGLTAAASIAATARRNRGGSPE